MQKVLRSIGLALFLGAVAPTMLPACGDSDESGDAQNATATEGRFETFVGQDDQYYFQMIAGNGERVLRSEGYTTLASAKKGISSVKKNGAKAGQYEVLEAVNGEFYFNLKAGNGEIIGTSETYVSKSNAERAVDTVKSLITAGQAAATKNAAKFETFKGADNQYYFRFRAGNGEITLQSEGYTTKANANKGITSVKKNGVSFDKYEIVEAQNGQHFFRIIAANGEIIARGEMYVSKSNAQRGARTVRDTLREIGGSKVTDAQVRTEIEDAAEGAIYVSESDYGFDYVTAKLSGQTKITESLVREKLASYVDGNEDADGPLADLFGMEGEFKDWKVDYKNCGEDEYPGPAECAEMRELVDALDLNLSNIKVFYFGRDGEPGSVDGVAVTIFIVGLTPEGNLAGVRTLAIWT